jgi:hypothetical protein
MLALLCVTLFTIPGVAQAGPPADKVLFDFENDAEVKAWSPVESSGAKVERSDKHATAGKHSLKITFAGGRWPAVATAAVPDDWMPWETFSADVTVERPCLIGFAAVQEGSGKPGGGWDAAVSRWVKTELLPAGTHTVRATLHPNGWSAIRPKLENGRVLGKVVRLEIFLYQPQAGDTVYVDNIRLLKEKLRPAVVKTQFRVLGTNLVVADVQELGKKLADTWKAPIPRGADDGVNEFRDLLTKLKEKHPKAVLAVLRDGEKGHDPAQPDKVYQGWRDAYWSSHGPDSMTVERVDNRGKDAAHEVFMRHRSPLMRVEVACIPKGAKVLAARLVLARARPPLKEHDPRLKPTMWVAEACNRPWHEYEVNAYEYARGKFWKEIGGRYYGEDPDFLPIFLAHGPGGIGNVNVWDFTEAVRYWQTNANHGFMLHGDSRDYFYAWTREAPEVGNRPALLVIYEPR